MRFTRAARRRFMMFDMTPMIDVVLQLIIFFMYTSQFAQLARTPIEMPEEAGDKAEHKPITLTIDIDATGQLLVEGEVVTSDELDRLLQIELDKAQGDPAAVRVLIRPDRTLPSLHLNRLADRLARLGLRGWRLGTSVPMGGGA